ncbi:MAG: DNA helicase [Ignavibacteriae bacterium]|nr:DNA helicase [Ignavibacteriota bacterium]
MAQPIELVLTSELKESYRNLPLEIQKKFDKQLRFLSLDPRHPSLKIHKLNGDWEFYVDIHYRCIFQRDGNKYILLTIGAHKLIDRYKIK